MIDRRSQLVWTFTLFVGSVLLSGCAGVRERLPVLSDDISQRRKARNTEIVQQFKQERNRGQFHAALSRRDMGDLAGARQQLHWLLQRDPAYAPAQQLLADVDAAIAHANGPPPAAASERLPYYAAADPNSVAPGTNAVPGPMPYPLSASPLLASGWQPPRVQSASYQTPADVQETATSQARQTPSKNAISIVLPPQGLRNDISRRPAQINQQAVQLLRLSQPDAAVAIIRPALADGNQSADLYRTLGLAHYRRGDYRASQLALQQALSLDNRHPLSYFLMGFVLVKLGDSHGADWHFREAAARDPKYAAMR